MRRTVRSDHLLPLGGGTPLNSSHSTSLSSGKWKRAATLRCGRTRSACSRRLPVSAAMIKVPKTAFKIPSQVTRATAQAVRGLEYFQVQTCDEA